VSKVSTEAIYLSTFTNYSLLTGVAKTHLQEVLDLKKATSGLILQKLCKFSIWFLVFDIHMLSNTIT
jgi:hypothetical protein